MGYYWAGYTEDINEIIKNCGQCLSENIVKKLPHSNTIIYSYGPHKRYQCDIWYLKGVLKENYLYEYVLDIIDHYSKCL